VNFLCLVGVSREGGGGGTAGEEGVYVSRYINVITKKKEPFVGMGTTAHSHPRCCCVLVFRGRLTRKGHGDVEEGVGKQLGRGGRAVSKLIYCSNIKKKEPFMRHDSPSPSSSLSCLCFHPHQAFPLRVVTSRAHAVVSGILFLTLGVNEASWCRRVVSWVVVEVLGDRGQRGMWWW